MNKARKIARRLDLARKGVYVTEPEDRAREMGLKRMLRRKYGKIKGLGKIVKRMMGRNE